MNIFEIDDILFHIFHFIGDYYFLPTFFVNKRFNTIANEVFLPHLYAIFDQDKRKWEEKNAQFYSIVKWCIDDLKISYNFNSVVWANADDIVIRLVYNYHKNSLKTTCMHYSISWFIDHNKIYWAKKEFKKAQKDGKICTYERNQIIVSCIKNCEFDLITEFFGPDVKFTHKQFLEAINNFSKYSKTRRDWRTYVQLINKQKELFPSDYCIDYNIHDVIAYDNLEFANVYLQEKGIKVDEVGYIFISDHRKLIEWVCKLDLDLPFEKLLTKTCLYVRDNITPLRYVLQRVQNLSQSTIREMWHEAQLYSTSFNIFILLDEYYPFPIESLTTESPFQINSIAHMEFIRNQCQQFGYDFEKFEFISYKEEVQAKYNMKYRWDFDYIFKRTYGNFFAHDRWLMELAISQKIQTEFDSIFNIFVKRQGKYNRPSHCAPLIRMLIKIIINDKEKVQLLVKKALENNDYQMLFYLHKMCKAKIPFYSGNKKFWHWRFRFFDLQNNE